MVEAPVKVEGDLLDNLLYAWTHEVLWKKGPKELFQDPRLPALFALPVIHYEEVRQKYYYIRRLPRSKFKKLYRERGFELSEEELSK
jgi:hypothetical protein